MHRLVAQDVVRHLCDNNMKAAAVEPGDQMLDITAGYDLRTTPRELLAASAGESSDATFGRFVATTEERFARDCARLGQGLRFDVRMPYGPMDWTIRVLHGFWDSWLHERDVLLARGIEHPADGDAAVYAAAYGLFIAAAVASVFGAQVQEKLTLSGDGGGVFELDNSDGVTLTVTRGTTAGPPAAEVTDALAGRAPVATVLGDLQPTRVPPCRVWGTSSTRLPSRARPDTDPEHYAFEVGCARTRKAADPDVQRYLCLVSETRQNVRDRGDASCDS